MSDTGFRLLQDVSCSRCGFTAADWEHDRCQCIYCGLIWPHYIPVEDRVPLGVPSGQLANSTNERVLETGRYAGMTESEVANLPNGKAYLEFVRKSGR